MADVQSADFSRSSFCGLISEPIRCYLSIEDPCFPIIKDRILEPYLSAASRPTRSGYSAAPSERDYWACGSRTFRSLRTRAKTSLQIGLHNAIADTAITNGKNTTT